MDRYRRLVEASNEVATIIDTDGTITYVSPAVTRVLGYDPGELVGNTGHEFVHPDDRERSADAVEAVLETSRRWRLGLPADRGEDTTL